MVVDHKFKMDRRINGYFDMIVNQNKEYFDLDFYNVDNFEWAFYTAHSKQIHVNYE